ncbi:hypothetical protein DFA_08429 [Cavenderia fasciculata]|uniref:ComC supersandwich domain-containing protein n=1 Tax=Cavenderia fasciculata TaxID=261658 RepID=F4Q660_CACFS|nr:uncharacterized protein DFA_08429 [Cavenderia fasciculata]EGG17434.1 hypothetical protein DFA_08429 [Cavenderia fasciculata]|eukprot:XP_004355918.1 hypothetical protein DFA_08429 [Cavenderia fasciculata]
MICQTVRSIYWSGTDEPSGCTGFDSVVWIIKQYGLSVGMNEATICAAFFCNIFNGTKHITVINLSAGGAITTLGPPDPSDVFDFPQLTGLSITASTNQFIGDANQSILTKLQNIPLLATLSLTNDGSLTTVPVGFPSTFGLPLLKQIRFVQSPLASIPGFFNQSTIQTLTLERLSYLVDFGIDSTVTLPNLVNLNLGVETPSVVNTIDLVKPSFPKLKQVIITLSNTNLNVNLDTEPNAIVRCISTINSTFNINVINTQNIVEFLIGGAQSTVVPSPTTWPNLKIWDVVNSPLTNTYPFSVYPPQVRSFGMTLSDLTAIPTTPLSPSPGLTKLSFFQSKITGDIQWQYFTNQPNGFELDLSYNTGITGVVPDSMCPYKLRISQTAISNLPSCYFCYYQSNSIMIISDVPVPQNYVCDITFESTDLIFLFGTAMLNGSNIGYGNLYTIGSRQINLVPTIPNKQLKVIDRGYQKYPGPKGIMSIQLDNKYPAYTYDMTSLEVGFNITAVSIVTIPQAVNGSEPVLAVVDTNFLYINITNPPDGLITFTISNSYFTAPPITYNYTQRFPIINSFTFLSGGLAQVGSVYLFNGIFEAGVANASSIYFNGDATICNITSVVANTIRCTQLKNIVGGATTITLSDNGFISRSPFQTVLKTPYSQCTQSTCQIRGTCDVSGECVGCKTGYYGVNCAKGYPKLSSGSYVDDTTTKSRIISLFGDFSPEPTNVTITVNGTWTCTPLVTLPTMVNCTIQPIPTTTGLVSVDINVNGSTNNAKDFILFRPIPTTPSSSDSSETPTNQCPNNCYGHGECIDSKCKCFEGYQVEDNCLTKIINNNTITPNTTAPTTSFDIDGVDFQFEIVAIQEIDVDSNIVQELLTDKWNATIYNDTQTTTVNYQLNTTSTTLAMVSATISFSSQPRDIPFGLETLHINANSIKVSVNISDWQYQSFLTTLRVIFKTTLSKDQSFEFDCQQQQIDSLQFDQLSSSIQYLRVVKDNIQFTGRFIDYVLSDGRPSFSKTYLINQTDNQDNDQMTTILIGISTPQCQSCILDPDFTPLLIDKSEDSGCEKKSNAWRIAVGVSVGGAALIAASVIAIKYRHNLTKTKKANKKMSQKLKAINQ